MIDLTPIMEAIIALVAAVITAFVIPWLKGKIDADKLEKIELWVTVAVEAAERQKRNNAHCAAREHAAEVAGFVPRIAAALCDAVGEQRKRQPSDHAQPHRLRKQHRADVVNRHAHHGENLQLVLGQQSHRPPLFESYFIITRLPAKAKKKPLPQGTAYRSADIKNRPAKRDGF